MLRHPGAVEAGLLGPGDRIENLAVKRVPRLVPLRRVAEVVEVTEGQFVRHALLLCSVMPDRKRSADRAVPTHRGTGATRSFRSAADSSGAERSDASLPE